MPEFWDVYDSNCNPTGQLHKRGRQLKSGQFHLVVDIVLINKDGRLLIDRRSPLKRNCPNFWEFTSGSVLAGESSRGGAVRELKEEIGVTASEQDLILLGSSKAKHRFVDTYMMLVDIDPDRLTLQSDEVAEVKLVTLNELDEICKEGNTWCNSTLSKYRDEIEKAVKGCLV